ncbi:hypothetical protein VNO80_08441 [Phaseolus coccineus]|uniref:Uncharacterized protein n=1 Tax=Phaseolus coccineus TaxID=3886 RepID=A0AAN9N515_PHACN
MIATSGRTNKKFRVLLLAPLIVLQTTVGPILARWWCRAAALLAELTGRKQVLDDRASAAVAGGMAA